MKKTGKTGKLRIQPLGDRVLIKPFSGEDKKSPSGIIIPETVSKEKPEQGKVVAVGNGRIDEAGKVIPLRVKVGDTIIFSKYGYDDVKVDGQEYFMVKEEHILAIIN
jgi:chaperonin GroES